ncbi:MAG: hypothetical protein GW762_00455 [Candidatus Pacebacteria bacterium]|nr:hypothetical protein [Candidatus Paceibacterota bacterium]
MIQRITQHFRRFFTPHIMLLALCWLAIVFTNFNPGTWLIGWDNLIPEVNIFLNLYKTIFSAWQSWQGLGIVGGIAHASELSRELILLPFALILPGELIRYIWTFAMLLVGMLGTYHLALWLLKESKHSTWIALVVAVAYTFNLATIQNFFVPLEAFSTFWGFFPLFLLTAFKLVKNPSKKSIFFFALIQFLGASAFHVQTMFIVYSLVLSIFTLASLISSRGQNIKALCVLWITLILVHFYWLAPVGYFTLTNAQQTVDSKQNSISTQEVFESNKAAGSLTNILRLKGYWFNYTDSNPNGTQYLMDAWEKHTNSLPVAVGSILISLVGIGGYILYLRSLDADTHVRTEYIVFFLTATLLAISMLTTGKGIVGLGYTVITKLPLLGQVFRVPFTKWSVVLSLFISIGIGYFLSYVTAQKKLLVMGATALFIALASIFSAAPLFSGGLFYSNVQLSLPSAYSHLFEELSTQPTTNRILYLPFDDFWGWMNHDWGYRGSGFIWYGIKQPIIDRNFDVWSVRNETLYTQLQQTLQTKNTAETEILLDKYDISLLLIDTSIQANQKRKQETADTIQALEKTGYISKIWEDDFLSLYKTTIESGELQVTHSEGIQPLEKRLITDTVAYAGSYYFDSNSQLHLPLQNLLTESISSQRMQVQNDQIVVPLLNQASKITIPSLEGMKQMYGIQLIGNKLTIEPIAPLHLLDTKTNTTRDIYSLTKMEYTFDTLGKKIYLDINDTLFTLNETEYRQIILPEIISQPVTMKISSAEDISTVDENTLQSTRYQELHVPSTLWQDLLSEKILESGPDEQLLLATLSELLPFDASDTVANNCDALSRGTTAKQITDQHTSVYTSNDFGIFCDGSSTQKMQANQDHFLKITATNTTGLPLRFYIKNNATETILLEQVLTDSANYFFVPQDISNGNLSVNIQNKSTGTLSKNTLIDVSLHELPIHLALLGKIKVSPVSSNAVETQSTEESPSDLSVSKFSTFKIGNFLYFISFASQSEQEKDATLLTVSQSYDAGWIAFSYSAFPTPLRHVEVDGWKNGWEIQNGKNALFILYWPQLGVFLGYILLFIVLKHVYLGVKLEKSENTQKKRRARQLYRVPKKILGGKK